MGYFNGEWSITDMTNPQQPTQPAAPVSITPKTTPGVTPVTAPKQPATFDAEEGMYDAYIKARNESIGADASKRKQERFYKKFRKQWDEGEALRKSEFEWNQGIAEGNKRLDDIKQNFTNRTQQVVQDFRNSVKPFENPVQKQETPAQEFKTNYWLSRAQEANPNFKSIDDVIAWQQQNGLVADGKFGDKSLAKWNELNSAQQPIEKALQQQRGNGRLTVEVPEEAYSRTPAISPKVAETAVTTEDSVNPFGYVNKPYDWSSSPVGKAWNTVSNFFSRDPRFTDATKGLPSQVQSTIKTYGVHKQGGNINKFSKGGNMNEQELQLAVIGYIMATKKQPKSEQEVQAIAQEVAGMKQSNPKQYQQLVQMGQQAQQQQAGAKVAALGSKLNYIRKIKGLCPEGE